MVLRRSAALFTAALSFFRAAPAGAQWHGPVTDHFDGTRFHSPDPITIDFGDWVKRVATKHRGPWRSFTPATPAPCPENRVADGRLRVTFINHGTVLIQMDGVNILTDPTWAERSVPVVGERRRRPPGLPFEDLPPIDVVLLSHDHHDHMDLPTLRRLSKEHGPAVFAGLGTDRFLGKEGVGRARDLDWWQGATIGHGVRVTAVPARHMSGRSITGKDRRLWCGFVVTGASGSVFYAGDSGFGSHIEKIAARFGSFRLALFPIGGFQPPWYMAEQHMGPRDALRAQAILHATTSVPVHYGTFPQSDDAELEPAAELRRALAEAPEPKPAFVVLDNGESLEVPPEPFPFARPSAAGLTSHLPER